MPNTPSKREAFEVRCTHMEAFNSTFELRFGGQVIDTYTSLHDLRDQLNAAHAAYIESEGLVKVEVTVVSKNATNHFIKINGEHLGVMRTREEAETVATKWRNILKGA